MVKVLFVCLGNICRSPMAEGLFKKYIEEQHMTHRFLIESRATSRYEIGNPPHKKTIEILNNHDIDTKDMKASQITSFDFGYFDYIFCMDKENLNDLYQMSDEVYHHKISLFIENFDIPDPWYTNDFNETYELIVNQIPLTYEKIKKDKGL